MKLSIMTFIRRIDWIASPGAVQVWLQTGYRVLHSTNKVK